MGNHRAASWENVNVIRCRDTAKRVIPHNFVLFDDVAQDVDLAEAGRVWCGHW